MKKNNRLSLVLTLSAVFFLISPNVFIHFTEGWMVFIFMPYLLLPIILLFGLSFWFTDNLGFKVFNILLTVFLSIIAFYLIFFGGSFSLGM